MKGKAEENGFRDSLTVSPPFWDCQAVNPEGGGGFLTLRTHASPNRWHNREKGRYHTYARRREYRSREIGDFGINPSSLRIQHLTSSLDL
jgi:hypothetical protein